MEGLGINLPLFIAFLINFVILFVLLSVFLYKPVTKMLNDRQAKIKESMEQAEAIKQQTAQTEQEIKKQLENAHKEAQKILAQATEIGDKLKAEAKDVARKEAESITIKAQAEIDRQREKDIQELRAQFADIAILAAEKVIKENIDKEKNSKIIDEVLKEKADFK
jgi:F-type H+-transporting ATPase subunit b